MENNTNFIDKLHPLDVAIEKQKKALKQATTQELIEELKTREDAGQFVDEETKENLHKLIEELGEKALDEHNAALANGGVFLPIEELHEYDQELCDRVEDALAALDNCRDFTEFNKHYKEENL